MSEYFYVPAEFIIDHHIAIEGEEAKHISRVLRKQPGENIWVVDGNGKAFEAVIRLVAPEMIECEILFEHHHLHEPDIDVTLAVAQLKNPSRMDWIIEKATELGVARITPVMTRRTIVERVNTDRMRANAIEAAEQSERLTVPEINEPVTLKAMLSTWDPDRVLAFCDEAGGAADAASAFAGRQAGKWAILTGPEGGFDPEERELIRSLTFSLPLSLGPRIMRADTAALSAIAVWQALKGDWR